VTAGATKRYLSLVVTHRGFPRGTRSAVGDTLTWSLTGAGAALGGTVKASDLHHAWLNSMAGGRTLGGARPFWVIPLGFVADGGATAGVTVTTASARGEWVVASVLTDDSQALAGVGGRFVAVSAGVPENPVRINDRPAAIPFAERPQLSGDSTASGAGAGFDSDGDFSPDLEEQAAGTDPQDEHSAPVVLSSLVITRETTRFRPNPYGGNGGWSELTINHGWEAAAGFPVLKRTWVLPPGYVNPLGSKFELPEKTFNGDTAEHGDDLAGRWNRHAAPVASRGLPSAELDGDAPVALFMGDGSSSAVGGFQREHIYTRGMRYRLRGPARLESQERTYIRARWVKNWPTVEAYYRDLMETGQMWFSGDGTPSGAPTSISTVTLAIPPSEMAGVNANYSASHDVVPQLPSIPENAKGVVLVTERLVAYEVAPDVIAVNSDFDEGRVDSSTGYAIPDCDDPLRDLEPQRAHLDGRWAMFSKVTEDMHQGWFGVRPGEMGADFWQGATVTIKKIERIDPDIDGAESGEVRFYATDGVNSASGYQCIEPYDLTTHEPVNLVVGGVHGAQGRGVYGAASDISSSAKFWIEGVKPGKITLEWRYSKGTAEFKYQQTFNVVTRKTRDEWVAEVNYQIRLQSKVATGTEVDVSTYHPGDGFSANVSNVLAIYYYYRQLFRQMPEKFMWAGMAKVAAAPIYAGMSDLTEWYYGSEFIFGARDVGTQWFINGLLLRGQRHIFDDKAWCHHAYMASGIWAIKHAVLVDGSDITNVDAWEDIDKGIRTADQLKINNGNGKLLLREQELVVQQDYEFIRGVWLRQPPAAAAWWFGATLVPVNAMGVANAAEWLSANSAKNPLNPIPPHTPAFLTSVPGGRLDRFVDRWAWTSNPTNGMLELWTGTSSAGPNFDSTKRMLHVDKSMRSAAGVYAYDRDFLPYE
jgi:hypothetical protein